MKSETHNRLEDCQSISVPVAAISGLWRRGILHMPGTADRRRYVRIPADDMARVSVVGEAASEPMEARVVDVSRGGMRLRIRRMLAKGTMVRVQLNETGVLAEVRYCVAAEGEFDAGVQVQSVL